jgi:hypothetical protein
VRSKMQSMFVAVLAALSVSFQYCPPQPWANGFGAEPRIPIVADVNGDGFADLVAVYPPGEAVVDVALSVEGQKCGRPFQALPKWRAGVQSVVAGEFDGQPGADLAGLFDGQTISLAAGFKENQFQKVDDWAKLPEKLPESFLLTEPKGALIAVSAKSGVGYSIDVKTRKIAKIAFPKGVVWGQSEAPRWAMRADGQIGHWTERGEFMAEKGLKSKNKGCTPAAAGSFSGV